MSKVSKCLLVAAIAGLASASACAQSTFMNVPGIPGESVNRNYEGWIEVLTLSQSYSTSGRHGDHCSLSVTKKLDRSGPAIWAAVATGQNFASVTIDLTVPGLGANAWYYRIQFSNVKFSAIATSADSANPAHEKVSLSAAHMTLTYRPQLVTGGFGTPVTTTVSCGR